VNNALAMLRLSFFIALMVVVDLRPGEMRRTLAPQGELTLLKDVSGTSRIP
jgi:hypothetical protein